MQNIIDKFNKFNKQWYLLHWCIKYNHDLDIVFPNKIRYNNIDDPIYLLCASDPLKAYIFIKILKKIVNPYNLSIKEDSNQSNHNFMTNIMKQCMEAAAKCGNYPVFMELVKYYSPIGTKCYEYFFNDYLVTKQPKFSWHLVDMAYYIIKDLSFSKNLRINLDYTDIKTQIWLGIADKYNYSNFCNETLEIIRQDRSALEMEIMYLFENFLPLDLIVYHLLPFIRFSH